MTERISLRREAQARYRALAQRDGAHTEPHPGVPDQAGDADPPHKGEGQAAASEEGGAAFEVEANDAPPTRPTTPLTTEVQSLYEAGVVPVREIARLAGVTERTLYKYVQRGGWTRRYAGRNPRGAGGRFVPVEQEGRPHARGLKALDPAGAEQAAAGCAQAGELAHRAQAAARAAAASAASHREQERRLRTFELLARAFVDLIKTMGEPNGEAVRIGSRLGHCIITSMERTLMQIGREPARP